MSNLSRVVVLSQQFETSTYCSVQTGKTSRFTLIRQLGFLLFCNISQSAMCNKTTPIMCYEKILHLEEYVAILVTINTFTYRTKHDYHFEIPDISATLQTLSQRGQ